MMPDDAELSALEQLAQLMTKSRRKASMAPEEQQIVLVMMSPEGDSGAEGMSNLADSDNDADDLLEDMSSPDLLEGDEDE